MNYDEKLKNLKADLDKATSLKYRAEAKLEQLQNQEKELIEELKSLNISPEDLESEIKRLEGDIDKLFKKAEDLLPKDIL